MRVGTRSATARTPGAVACHRLYWSAWASPTRVPRDKRCTFDRAEASASARGIRRLWPSLDLARALLGWAVVSETDTDARRIATDARDRVRFEEDALALSDQVYRVARHLVQNPQDADDLMQETYARAFRSWRSFTPGTNLRAWLLRILTNLNIDRGRKQQRSPDVQPLEEGDYFLYNKLEETSDGPTDEERVVERLSQDDVVAALSTVPHDFRDVVVLVDIVDFTYADAAQILDIPVGTVMSRLHRGRRILKKAMAESAVGEDAS